MEFAKLKEDFAGVVVPAGAALNRLEPAGLGAAPPNIPPVAGALFSLFAGDEVVLFPVCGPNLNSPAPPNEGGAVPAVPNSPGVVEPDDAA